MLDLTTVPKELLTATKTKEGRNILSPLCRIGSFPQVFEPNASDSKYDPKKYVIEVLIPNVADISFMKSEAARVAVEKWGADKVKNFKLTTPFNDAGDKKVDGYIPGWIRLKLKSESRPQIVDPNIRDATGKFVLLKEDDGSHVYPGRWCRITCNPFTYEVKDKGVSFGLNSIMLLHHDDSIGGGRPRAEDEFETPAGFETTASVPEAKTANDLF